MKPVRSDDVHRRRTETTYGQDDDPDKERSLTKASQHHPISSVQRRTHLLHHDPDRMPTRLCVHIRKNQHGQQHQRIRRDADGVDLGDVESLGAVGVLDCFL